MLSSLVPAFMRDARFFGKGKITQPVKMKKGKANSKQKNQLEAFCRLVNFIIFSCFPNEINIFEYNLLYTCTFFLTNIRSPLDSSPAPKLPVTKRAFKF